MTFLDTGIPGFTIEVIRDGSDLQPTPAELNALASLCVGLNVLDLGTGSGSSAKAMLSTAKTVTTVENDKNWQGKAVLPDSVIQFHGDWRDVPGEFDLVFIDHFPIQDRINAVAEFVRRNYLVVLHDSHILANAIPGFEHILETSILIHPDHSMYLLKGVSA